MMSSDYYRREICEGMKMRNHAHPILRKRNRLRVRHAIRRLRERRGD